MFKSKSKSMVAVTVAGCLSLSGLLAACSQTDTKPAGTGGDSKPQAAPQAPAKKHKVRAMNILFGAAPPERSSGIKAIEERYNIEYEYIPVASGEYSNKLGVVMASGDIPDLVLTPDADSKFYNYAQKGAFLPLEKYVKDSKAYPNLAKIPAEVWEAFTYNGHIYAVPRLRALEAHTIVIREDWLKKLNLKVPTNYDEFYEVMKAFTDKDPDGNGKKDTYGMALSTGGSAGKIDAPSMFGSFRSMIANGWVDDGQGGIAPNYFGPKSKDALALMRKWYDEGIINKDFPIMKNAQAEDDFLTGKAGAIYNFAFNAINIDRLNKARAVNPNFAMLPIPALKAQDGYQGYLRGPGHYGGFFIPSTLAKDEDKVKKLLSILDDMVGEQSATFYDFGVEGTHFTKKDGKNELTELGKSEGPGKYVLTNPPVAGDRVYAATDTDEIRKLKDISIKAFNEGKPYSDKSIGILSQTRNEKGTELDKFAWDGVVAIIIGKNGLDTYDKLVADWKSRGGDQLLKEMNEGHKKKAK